jgi:5-methylcytosine-specific restriction protein A
MRYDPKPLNTPTWRDSVRPFVAHRASFRCEKCFRYVGMHGQVDHIQPRDQEHVHGMHVYDPTNLQYLCPSCHSAKTNVERQEAAGGTGGETGKCLATRPPRRSKVPGREKFMSAAGIPPIPETKRKKPKC